MCTSATPGGKQGPHFGKQTNWEEGRFLIGKNSEKVFFKMKMFVSIENEMIRKTGELRQGDSADPSKNWVHRSLGLRLLPFRPPTASGANKFLAEQVHVGGLIIFQPFKSFAQNYLIRIFQGHTFKYDVISLTKQITLGSMGRGVGGVWGGQEGINHSCDPASHPLLPHRHHSQKTDQQGKCMAKRNSS